MSKSVEIDSRRQETGDRTGRARPGATPDTVTTPRNNQTRPSNDIAFIYRPDAGRGKQKERKRQTKWRYRDSTALNRSMAFQGARVLLYDSIQSALFVSSCLAL